MPCEEKTSIWLLPKLQVSEKGVIQKSNNKKVLQLDQWIFLGDSDLRLGWAQTVLPSSHWLARFRELMAVCLEKERMCRWRACGKGSKEEKAARNVMFCCDAAIVENC